MKSAENQTHNSEVRYRERYRRAARRRRTNIWLLVGVIILIALLIYWLTLADFSGDTDVAAAIAPILG